MHDLPEPKPTIVVWSDLNDVHMQQLDQLNEPSSINKFFMKTFQFQTNEKQTMILCDLFYYALMFARNHNFNHEQTSSFLSILKRVHEVCTRTPFSNVGETYEFFKAMILKHSYTRPPHSLRIFTPDLTKLITEYVVDTYFRHYKMYKFLFTPTIDYRLKFDFRGMKPPPPATPEVVEPTEETNNNKSDEEQTNGQLNEVRKLVRSYLDEEMRKIQLVPPPAAVVSSRLSPDKQHPVKSSSTKASKPRTPK